MKRSAAMATLAVVLIMTFILVLGGIHVILRVPAVTRSIDVVGAGVLEPVYTAMAGISEPVSNVTFSTAMTATGMQKPYELPFVMPGMTALTTGGYSTTASSTVPGYFPWHAFDQGGECWVPEAMYNTASGAYAGTTGTTLTDSTGTTSLAMGEYIQLLLPDKFMLIEYSLSILGSWTPCAWTLAGLNDDNTWRCLDVQSGYVFPNDGGPSRIFAITQYLGSFSQFRLVIQQLNAQVASPQTNLFVQEFSVSGLKDDFLV